MQTTNRLKIAILSTPSSEHTQKWVNFLANYPIDILLLGFSNAPNLLKSHFPSKDITFSTLPHSVNFQKNSFFNISLIYTLILMIKSVYQFHFAIKAFKPQLLHAHYATRYGLLGSFLKGHRPLFISFWGSDIFDFPRKSIFHKWFIQYILKVPKEVFSTSHCMAKEINKYTRRNINVIPFGVDMNKYFNSTKTLKPTSSTIVLGNVKHLYPESGTDYLLRAFKTTSDHYPNLTFKLLIIGEGYFLKDLQSLADELSISDSVTFLGQVMNEKIPEYLNMMDIYIAPSIKESFGVSVVEAMACKIPVIVSDAPGLKEVVQDNISGIIVPKKNSTAIFNSIVTILENKQLKNKLIYNAYEKIKTDYNISKNVEQLIYFYNKHKGK